MSRRAFAGSIVPPSPLAGVPPSPAARAGSGVREHVEDRLVGDRIRAVLHRLRLAVRRRDRAAIEVIAADDDRRLHLAGAHELVEREPDLRAVAVAEPADARRQALE